MRRMYSKNQLEEIAIDKVQEDIKNGKISTSESIEGYSFKLLENEHFTIEPIYVGIVKNGNKLTIVIYSKINKDADAPTSLAFAEIYVPLDVSVKLIPTTISGSAYIDNRVVNAFSAGWSKADLYGNIGKPNEGVLRFGLFNMGSITASTDYYFRYEATFLLSDNLIEE